MCDQTLFSCGFLCCTIHNPPLDCAPAARRTPRRCPTPSRGSRWAAGPPATVLEPQSLTTVIGTARAHQAAARVPRLLRGIGPHRRRIPEVGIRVVPATEVGRQQLVHQHEVRRTRRVDRRAAPMPRQLQARHQLVKRLAARHGRRARRKGHRQMRWSFPAISSPASGGGEGGRRVRSTYHTPRLRSARSAPASRPPSCWPARRRSSRATRRSKLWALGRRVATWLCGRFAGGWPVCTGCGWLGRLYTLGRFLGSGGCATRLAAITVRERFNRSLHKAARH